MVSQEYLMEFALIVSRNSCLGVRSGDETKNKGF